MTAALSVNFLSQRDQRRGRLAIGAGSEVAASRKTGLGKLTGFGLGQKPCEGDVHSVLDCDQGMRDGWTPEVRRICNTSHPRLNPI